ncbi:hypothetical protein MMC22_000582 [Lobaria immixta]|nr:hypothetical protein [Lobaria immixta]
MSGRKLLVYSIEIKYTHSGAMTSIYLVTALLAISPFISCQAHGAANLTSNASISIYPAKTGYGAPRQPSFTFEELFHLQNRFWKNFISPANEKQAKAINSSLLAEDVLGRIDITRNFEGRELNTEYLFGLFASLAASPNSVSLLGVPLSYEITHFAANQNIASASTRVIFNTTGFFLPVPITIDTWITFNSAKEISQYDAVFKWWPWAIEYILGNAATKLGTKSLNATVEINATVEKLSEALAKSICSTAQDFCTGLNVQYSSERECQEFLTRKVRFGQAHEAGMSIISQLPSSPQEVAG